MNLTLIPKTTILNNIKKFSHIISISKRNSDKVGRPITHFYIPKKIRNASKVSLVIDKTLILKSKKLIIPKIIYKPKKNKRDNPTNHITTIRKPKAYILPKKVYVIPKPTHLKFINEV